MLALVSIFLFTIIVSAMAIWIYRKLSGWQGFKETLVGRPQSSLRMKISTQQGFISLASKGGMKSKNVKLRSPRGTIKKPWGW